MKRKFYLSLVVVALLYLAGWVVYGQVQRANTQRVTYEYRIEKIPSEPNFPGVFGRGEAARLLNQLGAEGWELTGIGTENYYFKRAR